MTGVILAGGQATRFGTDKAFALWNGKPFLKCVHDAVRPVCDNVIVLTPPAAELPKYARLAPGCTLIPDPRAGAGPVEAMRGAVDFLRAATLLIVPCDAPGLTIDVVKRLLIQSEETNAAVVLESKAGPIFDLFAAPRNIVLKRLADAKRMEDLVKGARTLKSDLDGLNVNEAPQ